MITTNTARNKNKTCIFPGNNPLLDNPLVYSNIYKYRIRMLPITAPPQKRNLYFFISFLKFFKISFEKLIATPIEKSAENNPIVQTKPGLKNEVIF